MNPTSSGGRQRLAGIAREAMRARGLVPEIPAAAIAQLAGLDTALPQPSTGVRDLRALPWGSIDNDDSRDLDQLSVAGTSPSGAQTVLVAVADVDALVKKGTPIDEHAQANPTSVYTAAGVFPMLPEQLSTDLAIDPPNRAKELIEEFMVGANRATARFLDAHHSPSLRRVLRSPERWDRICELAATKGDRLGPQPDSKSLDAFLRKQRDADPGHFADLSLAVIKLIGRGEYAADLPGDKAPGHFGLAVQDYAHSTAPNRRFPDLIGQRLVKAALAGEAPPYSGAELKALAEHCSAQEANADKVERLVRKSAAAMLLATRIGDVFDAVVTGASDKGTWVRVSHPAAEGRLFGKLKGLDVGDRLQVKLKGLDVERGFIDFALAAKPAN